MRVGERVAIQPDGGLSARHIGIRFDKSMVAVSTVAPKGAAGHVLDVNNMGEALVEIYWNDNPISAPGAGEVWRFWIKLEWFGIIRP
ncbi:hypothetical protein [Pseudomonas putida]